MAESCSDIKDAIGGYFSIELNKGREYHFSVTTEKPTDRQVLPGKERQEVRLLRLNTGRNCLEYILRCHQYKKVYIPYYTCEVILEPFKKTGTEYTFYHIDLNFELTEDICLQQGEALLYTNYFGLKQRYAEKLANRYGQQLIIDNTQAFFAKPIRDIDTFYTCRKFFGVPDGAYLYTTEKIDIDIRQDISFNRMQHLLKRIDMGPDAGYVDFRKADDGLDNQPIKKMSKLTERMMQSIDYGEVAKQRRENFIQLNNDLEKTNQLHISLDDDAVPMVYPYMNYQHGIREYLISKKVFLACYWPNVADWMGELGKEVSLAQDLLPLPIDQRYNSKDMQSIIRIISK